MRERAIWEEKLFVSDIPLPRRSAPTEPAVRARRQYTEPGLPLVVWAVVKLAPVPRAWEPLPEGREAVYLSHNLVLRVGLVDFTSGVIHDWQRTAASAAYAPRQPRAAPDVHPMDRRRSHRRTPPPDASPGRPA